MKRQSVHFVPIERIVKGGGMTIAAGDVEDVLCRFGFKFCRHCAKLRLVSSDFYSNSIAAVEVIQTTMETDEDLSEWLREHGDSGEYDPHINDADILEAMRKIDQLLDDFGA